MANRQVFSLVFEQKMIGLIIACELKRASRLRLSNTPCAR
jgi:hypothetical protein